MEIMTGFKDDIMKKTLFILSVSAMLLAACEEINETYSDPAPQLDVTSSYVIFDSDGGTKTVLVASSDEWTCSCNVSWIGYAPGEGLLEITVGANSSGANRQGTLTVTSGDLSRTISVAQVTVGGIDLSESGSANCYIAKTGTAYRFNATVKGNGVLSSAGGVGSYIDSYGTSIDADEIVYADLLWEAAFDGDMTRSCTIIDEDPVYINGYVHFTTGETEGNAVIAVKDAVGNVLWSWHIWVCDSEIGETEGNGYYWQDRNLGALSNEPGELNNRGLLYQWGRKDPFLPSCAEYGAGNMLNDQVGDGSGTWDYSDFTAKGVLTAPGNIPLSILNPMSVILPYRTVYSWYITAANTDNCAAALWGESDNTATYSKTIFDPCPPGYNVPVAGAWVSANGVSAGDWSSDGNDPYGCTWTGGGNAYYPLAGAYLGTGGEQTQTGECGYYFTSGITSSNTDYYVYAMCIDGSDTPVYGTVYPIRGLSVRCMRIK